MFLEDDFAEFGKDKILFCHITSQIDGEKYGDLLSSVGGTGFPTMVALDAEGKVLAKLKGMRTVENFDGMLKSGKETLTQLKEWTEKAAKGDAKAINALLAKQIELGQIDLPKAKSHLADSEKLTPATKKLLEGIVAEGKIMAVLKKIKRGDNDSMVAAGKELGEMIEKGEAFPQGRVTLDAHYVASRYAKEAGKVELFKKCAAVFKKMKGINPRFLEQLDKELAELEKAKGGDADKDK